MAEIKLIQIVNQLVQAGHQVTYTRRNDGSLRITSIDGTRYKGSAGNIRARQMLGVTISTRREKQLERIKTEKGKWGHKRKTPLPEGLQKELQRVQRIWRKYKVKKDGTITTPNVRYVYLNYGEQEAYRRLLEAERYARGLAYTENVKAIISYIDDAIIPKTPKEDLDTIIEFETIIATNISRFREDWIAPTYELLYDYNKYLNNQGGKSARTILTLLKQQIK